MANNANADVRCSTLALASSPMRLDRFDLNLLMIGTHRIATLHCRLARYFARHLPLRVIDAPFAMPALAEVMAWPRYLDQDPAHLWLRGALLESAARLSVVEAGA